MNKIISLRRHNVSHEWNIHLLLLLPDNGWNWAQSYPAWSKFVWWADDPPTLPLSCLSCTHGVRRVFIYYCDSPGQSVLTTPSVGLVHLKFTQCHWKATHLHMSSSWAILTGFMEISTLLLVSCARPFSPWVCWHDSGGGSGKQSTVTYKYGFHYS